jgi:hypothetical protein
MAVDECYWDVTTCSVVEDYSLPRAILKIIVVLKC